jgi:hypothetical protein
MKRLPQENEDGSDDVLRENSTIYRTSAPDIDLSLLRESLAKTPWERMLANDDALNFAESLRLAMKKRRA